MKVFFFCYKKILNKNIFQLSMDNSAYVPSAGHMSSPALVVFSQATGGLTEALRIQRPFNPQLQLNDGSSKDLHRPFNSGLSFRHMEAYNSLPAHLLHHLQPQFLHPSLSLGSGAFRPLADLKSYQSPSAFGPPKCLKLETDGFFTSEGSGGGAQRTSDSCSPASASLSPPAPQQPQGHLVKEESMDAHASEDDRERPASCTPGPCMSDENHGHEENKGFRLGGVPAVGGFAGYAANYAFNVPGQRADQDGSSRNQLPQHTNRNFKANFLFDNLFSIANQSSALNKQQQQQQKKKNPSFCPICGVALSIQELDAHFLHELEGLYKLSGPGAAHAVAQQLNKRRPQDSPMRPMTGDSGPEGRWETYQRIKTNRQSRLRSKLRKRKLDGSDCPVCMDRLHRVSDDLSHDDCQRKSGMSTNSNDEDETVDVEGDSEFEDWTSPQSRILERNAEDIRTNKQGNVERKDGDQMMYDGNESRNVATTPYSETSDVIVANIENTPKEQSGDGIQSQVTTSSGDVDAKSESGQAQGDNNVSTSDAEPAPSSRSQLVEELRSRIRQLEAEAAGDTATSTQSTDEFKCLVCLDHYKKPVTSTVCWHVHCEECWLHTLGTKKVCPQCSMITTPSDLRRIFM